MNLTGQMEDKFLLVLGTDIFLHTYMSWHTAHTKRCEFIQMENYPTSLELSEKLSLEL